MTTEPASDDGAPTRAPTAGKIKFPPQPPQRSRPLYRETPDVVDGVERLILAVGKRVATEDPVDLEQLRRLERALDRAWRIAIDGQRATFSDKDIADALGVTRPAVSQRWRRRDTLELEPDPYGFGRLDLDDLAG